MVQFFESFKNITFFLELSQFFLEVAMMTSESIHFFIENVRKCMLSDVIIATSRENYESSNLF